MAPEFSSGPVVVFVFSCGCSIGSFYAFLLLQRARIFGLASLMLMFMFSGSPPSMTQRERERESAHRRFLLVFVVVVRVFCLIAQVRRFFEKQNKFLA